MASYCFRSHPKKGRGTSFPLPPQILHDVCQMSGGRQAAMSHHYFPFVPPHLTLPGKTTFLIMVYFWPSQCDFKKFSRVTQKIKTQTIFSILLKINIFVCWILKLFCNEIFDKFDWAASRNITKSNDYSITDSLY